MLLIIQFKEKVSIELVIYYDILIKLNILLSNIKMLLNL